MFYAWRKKIHNVFILGEPIINDTFFLVANDYKTKHGNEINYELVDFFNFCSLHIKKNYKTNAPLSYVHVLNKFFDIIVQWLIILNF